MGGAISWSGCVPFPREGWLKPESLGWVEAVIRRIAFGSVAIVDHDLRLRLRDATSRVVRQLPALTDVVALKSWITQARSCVQRRCYH